MMTSRAETPRQFMSSCDQRVTQWKSVVSPLCGKSLNVFQLKSSSLSTSPNTRKFQLDGDTSGAKPISSTGKSCTCFWPGGMGGLLLAREGFAPRLARATLASIIFPQLGMVFFQPSFFLQL